MHFDWNLIRIGSQGPIDYIFGSGNGLVLDQHQAITWTKDDQLRRHKSPNELTHWCLEKVNGILKNYHLKRLMAF